MFPDELRGVAREIIEDYKKQGKKIATVESCTGGSVVGALTEISGSSAVVDAGFVTYCNEAKTQMVGVDAGFLAKHGPYNEETAAAMARGALDRSRADVALSITGIAGPDSVSPDKPAGMVCFGLAARGMGVKCSTNYFAGNRDDVRYQATRQALLLLKAGF